MDSKCLNYNIRVIKLIIYIPNQSEKQCKFLEALFQPKNVLITYLIPIFIFKFFFWSQMDLRLMKYDSSDISLILYIPNQSGYDANFLEALFKLKNWLITYIIPIFIFKFFFWSQMDSKWTKYDIHDISLILIILCYDYIIIQPFWVWLAWEIFFKYKYGYKIWD